MKETQTTLQYISKSMFLKWVLVFFIVVFIPLILFALFWINFQPRTEVFFGLMILYLILSVMITYPAIKDSHAPTEKE